MKVLREIKKRYEDMNGTRIAGNMFKNNGLSTVALDRTQEESLKIGLKSFISSETFYTKIGIPYKLGLLFYGEPARNWED